MKSELSMQGFRSHIRNLATGYDLGAERFVRSTQSHGGNRYSPTDYHAEPLGRRDEGFVECDFGRS